MVTVIYCDASLSDAGLSYSTYGSFILPREAGVYVFISLVFFALGMAFTMGIIKLIERNKEKGSSESQMIRKETDDYDQTR